MLLLASASAARQRLLSQAGIPHRVMVSGFEESTISDPDPSRLVQLLAEAKARAVALRQREKRNAESGLQVLGCDSVLAFEGEIFGKPADAAEATARWRRLAGRRGELHTGHCLLPGDGDGGEGARLRTVTTVVHFAKLSTAEIEAYVASGEPLRCAGGFALEGRGGCVIERIEGCYSNVIGLSLPLLRRWLAETSSADSD